MSNKTLKQFSTGEIRNAILGSYDGSKQVDISQLIVGMTLNESIAMSHYSGMLKIYDTIGLIEDFPLRGEETLNFDLIGNDTDYKKNISAFVYKISDVEIKNTTDGIVYVIHFMSKISFNAKLRSIISSFENISSEICTSIFKETFDDIKNKTEEDDFISYDINDGRQLIVEKSDGIIRVLIPNYTPQEAMAFLCNRTNSIKNQSCSYRFFETLDGYFFVTDEFLIRKPNDEDKNTFIYNDTTNDPTYAKDIYRKFRSMRNSIRADSLTDLLTGAYNSNIIEFDPFERKINEYKFKYAENKDLFYKTNAKNSTKSSSEKHTDNFLKDVFNDENERKLFYFKDYDSYSNLQIKGDGYLPKISNSRNAYNYYLASNAVEAQITGRLDVRAGKIIKVDVKGFNGFSKKDEKNKQLSGNYLVAAVTNSLDNGILTSTFQLLKFGWEDN